MSNADKVLFDKVIKDSQKGKVTRRDFLQYTLAAGLSMTASSALWGSEVDAATPKKGGVFRIGVHDGNTSDSLDPARYQSIADIQLAHTSRSYLTEITVDNTLGPDIADSWEANDDATVWKFTLNKGVTFHSGKSFTSKDAVASLNHHRGEKSQSAAKALLQAVTDIEADGDYGLIIKLSQGVADLPWLLADYHFVMCPVKEDGTIEWESGNGTGPYKIVKHEPGIRTTMVRHDAWHGEGAYFDGVEFTVLNDPNARQTALLTNAVDSITAIDLKTLRLLKRKGDIAIDNIPSGSAITIPMFCDTKPFDSLDVRLAMKYAIDREEIIKKVLSGTATLGNDVHVSPNMPYYAELEQRPYDPDKAKFHLKKAGFGDGLKVNLSTTDSLFSGAVDMCTLYAEQAKAAGIDINVVREASDGYWSNVWLKKPFSVVKWGARPTPDNMLSLAYAAEAPWNESHWKNKRFNELLVQARGELDEAKRKAMYHEMQVLAKDDGGTVLPAFMNFVYARRNNVMHGPKVSSSWENDGARAAQRWWFA